MSRHAARFSELGPSFELVCSGMKSTAVWVWTHALLNIFTLDSGGVLVIFFTHIRAFGSSFTTGMIFSRW